MKIAGGAQVVLHYELYDASGALVERTEDEDPVRYVHGRGEILPGLERALEGAGEGADLRVELAPDDAYGAHDPEGIVTVPREDIPGDVELEPGSWVTVGVQPEDDEESVEEGELEMRVVELGPDDVTLDANHPLAGQSVTFVVRVLAVEPA